MIAGSRRDSEPALFPLRSGASLLAQAVVDRLASVSAEKLPGEV
jgi:hypothetical protein